jgi:beta-glucosidase
MYSPVVSRSSKRALWLSAIILFAAAALAIPARTLAQEIPRYKDPHAPVAERVNDLLGRMTLDEKITLIAGVPDQAPERKLSLPADGVTWPIPRLGIPAIAMSGRPLGALGGHPLGGGGTCYPLGIALAASWDIGLAARFGQASGRDARARGIRIHLAPTMIDMYHIPIGGRNMEDMGEDPFLVSRMAVSLARAVQAQGVITTACIFCCNDQDFGRIKGLHRFDADSVVDERTLREIYFPPFRALAQEAHVGAFMASYNLFNGQHSTQNEWLLTEVLKKEWGFQGFVMSDWEATHDAVAAANAGLDIEMPTGRHFNKALLLPAIKNGTVKQATIDDKVRRLLREFFAFGFFDSPLRDTSVPLDNPESEAVALDMAREGTVLLKNEAHLLPFDRTQIRSVAVLGPNADPAVWGGSGSSYGTALHPVSVLDGIRNVAGASVHISSVPWRQFPPARPAPGFPPVRPVADLIADSVKAARECDAAIVCIGFKAMREVRPPVRDLSANEGEGQDRSYALPPGQAELVQAVTAANPRTIVILMSCGSVDWTGWLDKTPALIDAWFPGDQGGRAVAEMLFGDVSPSGKLPATFEKKWEDSPFSRYYDHVVANRAIYGDGIFMGYRGFDQNGIEPQFPFGFGLSYTTFNYDHLRVDQSGDSQKPMVTVHFDVKNTGKVAGAEIAQVYVGDPHASVPRPPKELKGFARIQLAPGETKSIDVALDRDAFSFFDIKGKSWKLEPGEFTILVGASSRDIRLKQAVTVPANPRS